MDYTALTDGPLFDLWRTAHDMTAFNEIRRRHRDGMLGFAYHLLKWMGVHDAAGCADECVQETFLRLSMEAEPIPCVRGWLYLTLKRRVIDEGRKRGGRLQPISLSPTDEGTASGIDPADEDPGPPQVLINAETAQRFWDCLHELPLGDFQVLVLRFILDRSYEEMAEQIGVTLQAVRSRLHRARQRFQERWQQGLGGSEGRSQS